MSIDEARTGRCTALMTCPVCGGRLEESGRALRCGAGHSFDRAREGYVDLLPAGHGRSRLTGDTAAMVRARRRFLERGHYGPLTAELEGLVLAELAAGGVMVDAGCGEGHYIARIARALGAGDVDGAGGEPSGRAGRSCLFGFDVSRDAVRLAARACPAVRFFINDVNHRICLADGSADVLLDCFAPRNAAEFGRVVRPGGLALVVIPGGEHLDELRSELPLLGIEPEKREKIAGQLVESFEAEGDRAVRFTMELDGAAVRDLVAMTPSRWHMDPQQMDRAAALGATRVTASFRVLGFRRR